MNFALGSELAFYISFGLNYQIEHHLFPGICHDHYTRLAPKVEHVCKKHGVHYWNEPSLLKSIWMLFQALIDIKEREPADFIVEDLKKKQD